MYVWVPGEQVRVIQVEESQGPKGRDRILHVTPWMTAENIVGRKTRPGETVFKKHWEYFQSW